MDKKLYSSRVLTHLKGTLPSSLVKLFKLNLQIISSVQHYKSYKVISSFQYYGKYKAILRIEPREQMYLIDIKKSLLLLVRNMIMTLVYVMEAHHETCDLRIYNVDSNLSPFTIVVTQNTEQWSVEVLEYIKPAKTENLTFLLDISFYI